jgi:hypothetical protein
MDFFARECVLAEEELCDVPETCYKEPVYNAIRWYDTYMTIATTITRT